MTIFHFFTSENFNSPTNTMEKVIFRISLNFSFLYKTHVKWVFEFFHFFFAEFFGVVNFLKKNVTLFLFFFTKPVFSYKPHRITRKKESNICSNSFFRGSPILCETVSNIFRDFIGVLRCFSTNMRKRYATLGRNDRLLFYDNSVLAIYKRI